MPGTARSAARTYTITELAAEFDITARAIRFYEDQGLLSPKREGAGGRSRVYTPRDRTRLKLTLRGKRLGLSLQEIKQLVDLYESPSDTRQQLTAFMAVLGRVDGIVFTAGIGENDAIVRANSLQGLEFLGVRLDPEENSLRSKQPRCISSEDSRVRIFVIPTNEELAIAREVSKVVGG